MKAVTFGEIMIRLASPGYERLIQSDTLEVGYAGAEANVAVSLANYGVNTDYITCLPVNPMAERCIRKLRGMQVGVDNIQRSGKRMGILYLETGSNARPSKVYYDRENSSIAEVEPNSIDWPSVLKDADWFHWTGITPALSRNTALECLNALRTAKELGLAVSCDLNYRGNLWDYGKSASEVMPQLVEYCDFIMGNEEDFEKIFGIKPHNYDVNTHGEEMNPELFIDVCMQVKDLFPRCRSIVMTLRGSINANHNTWESIMYDGDTLYRSKRYEITDIVDRVGGGDSFMGAFIYALNHYNSKQDALEFATAASCLKHTIKGDFNQVSKEEVENLLKGDQSGRVKR